MKIGLTSQLFYENCFSSPEQVIERFLEKVQKTDDCWLWQGAISSVSGYGNVTVNKIQVSAHKLSYLLFVGDTGVFSILHRCDNPACVNPKHLFLVTQKENMEDKMEKGRGAVGQKNGNSKLTPELVLRIREAVGSENAIAKALGVSRPTVHRIRSGKGWKHI